MKHPTRVVVLAALCALAATTACGAGATEKATPSTSPATVSSPPASTTSAPPATTAPPVVAVNPLTGVAPVPAGPVVAVKIDDTASGRPMRNINQADVVYIEQVEGGLSRLLAVFATNKPVVESVRSTRASDPELVAQYGPIDYVASGGAANPLQVLDASPLKTTINDRNGPGFTRDNNRYMPYNLMADLAKVSTALNGAGTQDVGFTWSVDPSVTATAAAGTTLSTKVGATRFDSILTPRPVSTSEVAQGVQQQESDGALVSTPNVIVQFWSATRIRRTSTSTAIRRSSHIRSAQGRCRSSATASGSTALGRGPAIPRRRHSSAPTANPFGCNPEVPGSSSWRPGRR